jgi:rhodanese-related sulfurtransferase
MSAAARQLTRPQRAPLARARATANRPLANPPRAGGNNSNGTRMFVGEAQLRPTSPAGWEAMRTALRDAGVTMVAPQELAPLRARGAVVVDVRPEGDHANARIPGAESAPIYRLIAGWSPEQLARRVGFALFGVFKGTEVNPNFVEAARAAAAAATASSSSSSSSSGSSSSSSSSSPTIVLYCSQGGSVEAVGAAASAAAAGPVGGGAGGGTRGLRGWQSRSLIAAYALVASDPQAFGNGRVAVLRGGFSEWVRGGREVEGEGVEVEEEGGERQQEA